MKNAKAYIGALIAGLTAVATAMDDGAVSSSEWVVVAVATLSALGLVWAVPNAPADPSKPPTLHY